MGALNRDPVFVALTRPQMFAGVTYGYFVAIAIVTTEFFLVFRSAWVLAIGLAMYVAGVVACLREPFIFALWRVRIARCPRVRNHRYWRCNSYRP